MFSYRTITPIVFLISIALSQSAALAKVEAIKGKRYKLTPKHGPWMILVASLRDVPPERRTRHGLTALQAADQLVYELRRIGIPAYAFLQTKQMGQLAEFSSGDVTGDEKKYIARQEAIGVLAGNFGSPDDKHAKEILNYLKKEFQPTFLKDERYGGILPSTPGRPTPLSRAHMTVNPLMSAADVKRKSMDPIVKKLNSDMEYSLLKNKGKYTLRVATFQGSAILQVGNQVQEKAQKHFDKVMGNNLDASGTKAWELTEALRSASKLGYDRNYEAYVYHDRYKSIVTIGSFDSPSDPRIAELARQFRGKQRVHEGNDVLTAEVFTIPRNLAGGKPPEKFWMFDTLPTLEDVPKLR